MMTLIALVLDRILSFVLLLPLQDTRGRHRTFSAMTWGLIVINVAIHVFFYALLPWWLQDEEAWAAIRSQIMLVPADILEGTGLGALSMLTSAFLHADGHTYWAICSFCSSSGGDWRTCSDRPSLGSFT
jgi:hypothetical protein